MNLDCITKVIENAYPLSTQEEWDNSGYQIRLDDREISEDTPCVLVALDVTEEVIAEAERKNADLIVSHHPLIFGGLGSIDGDSGEGKNIVRLIEDGISVYSCHTPFDKGPGGNNDYLAEILHLRDVEKMPADDSGCCRIGTAEESFTLRELAEETARRLDLPKSCIRLTEAGESEKPLKTVGLCTGAGGQFIEAAGQAGCDVFITGDVKYHEACKAKAIGLALIDIGHFGSETIFRENMAAFLSENTEGIIMLSRSEKSPFTPLTAEEETL